jgi:hypothetical protein
MASPFQQQAQRRKLTYVAAILVLFTVAFLWRNYSVARQAKDLALREEDQGEVQLTGSVVRLGLTGSRGLATCALWMSAIDKQKKNQWNELELLVRSVTTLQPHFITPWLFQSWNLAYNVSVESDRVNDKYFYVTRGIQLLAEGERLNRDNPDLRYWIGFYHQHKICKSDETNVERSLFQLSLIPPNERDPARFKKVNANNQEEIDLVELEDFCKKHPQLARRLREGLMRDTKGEHFRQFTCATAADVVRFLADNLRVPSPYEEPPVVAVGQWQKREDEKLRPLAERFPPLPPKRNPAPPQHLFDPTGKEMTADQVGQLPDSVDAYAVARAWYGYAQEPIPDAGDLPGSTKEITDRARQRKPKQITTIIFRNQPSLAQGDLAQRLQQEGWFDNSLWQITSWFPRDRFPDNTPARVGDPNVKWSLEAWDDAYNRWLDHGTANHINLNSTELFNMEKLAAGFNAKFGIQGNRPPPMRTESLDEETREGYHAAEFMFEYNASRNVSNFQWHLERSDVERKEEAVEGRKQFYTAERLRWNGAEDRSMDEYAKALVYWRDKVLLKYKTFRRDTFIQEESYDWQYRYLRMYHEAKGDVLKDKIGGLARFVPLLPAVNKTTFTGWILHGPLDEYDEDGLPLIGDEAKYHVLSRKPGGGGSPTRADVGQPRR